MDENLLIDLVDIFRKLNEARMKNIELLLTDKEVRLMHDHLKAFFGSLSSSN